jgi:phage/plasmid-associated DNA primase
MGCYGSFTDVKTFAGGKDSEKELAKMPGIRYLFAGEPTKGQHLEEGLLKSFTGGDPVINRGVST